MSEADSQDPQEDQYPQQGAGSTSKRGGRSKSRMGNAAKGAASGAAKEAGKQAAIQGAKGAVKGAQKGAQLGGKAGAAVGTAILPGVGTAIGGALGAGAGAAGGAAVGGAAGAAKGGMQGAAKGGAKGAAKGAAKNPRAGGEESRTKAMLKKSVNRVVNKAAKAAGPEAQVALKAKQFLDKHKTLKKIAIAGAIVSSPVGQVMIPLGIILFLIVVVMGGPSEADPNAPKLTITKTGPIEAQNGQELPYEITVAYPEQAIDIVITDKIPEGTEYVDSSPSAQFDPVTKTATWNLKDFQASPGAILSNVNSILAIKLRAVKNDLVIFNQAEGTVTPYAAPTNGGGGGGPISDGYVPPAPNDDCGGKYNFSKYPEQNPLGNYGDPKCNFSKDNLYKHLQSKEPNPEFVNIWFDMIVPVESGFSPNAFAPPVGVQCSLDCAGAWGLYQMGSSKPSGQPPTEPGKNGIYDRGDLNWEIQTTKAIDYNMKLLGCNFRYWASARSVWGKYSC
ncbi:MAG TPA: hypothetical protein VM077_04545 [Candidatus Limnocylindrales bacterium]|nr:hypothetical protein [Candidatus Limnocylindrales bacterium]